MDRIYGSPMLPCGTLMWARDLSGSLPPAGLSTKQLFMEPLEVKIVVVVAIFKSLPVQSAGATDRR